jgi:hypothetical protein
MPRAAECRQAPYQDVVKARSLAQCSKRLLVTRPASHVGEPLGADLVDLPVAARRAPGKPA